MEVNVQKRTNVLESLFKIGSNIAQDKLSVDEVYEVVDKIGEKYKLQYGILNPKNCWIKIIGEAENA